MAAKIEVKAIILAIILLCISSFFCDVCVIDGNSTSFAEILFLHRGIINHFSYNTIIKLEYGDWYFFVMPVCISISTIPILCRELKSGYYRFIKLRSGDKRFIWECIIANILATLVVFILSTLIFRISIWLILGGNIVDIFAFQLADIFYNLIYILMISGIAIIMTVLSADVYVAITSAFMINYIIYSWRISIGWVCLFTALTYISCIEVIKKRWIEC